MKAGWCSEGFTLIELMVVIALIAIMMAIAVPSFVSFISNYRATSAINDFLQGVTLTRTEALKRGQRVLMVPNQSDGITPSTAGSWINGWTVFVDNNNDQTLQANDDLIYKHSSLPASITTVGAAGGVAFADAAAKTYVQFDGTGYPRLLSGAVLRGGIVMTDRTGNATNVRTLCLANLGRPRIRTGLDPNGCAGG